MGDGRVWETLFSPAMIDSEKSELNSQRLSKYMDSLGWLTRSNRDIGSRNLRSDSFYQFASYYFKLGLEVLGERVWIFDIFSEDSPTGLGPRRPTECIERNRMPWIPHSSLPLLSDLEMRPLRACQESNQPAFGDSKAKLVLKQIKYLDVGPQAQLPPPTLRTLVLC